MKKRWVIPDIHGCSRTLRALIEEQIRPSRSDEIYFLGDYIDRGPDSRGVIDFIMQLQKDEYSIRLLKGNHEDFLFRLYNNQKVHKKYFGIPWRNMLKADWLHHGGRETLKSFGVKDVHDIPRSYIDWISRLEMYIQLEDLILVHAGFNFSNEDPFEDTHAMLWIKDFSIVPGNVGNRRIVHGHVPVSLEFIDLTIKNEGYSFIDLDNGIYITGKNGFGNLVALEINSMQLAIQPNLDMG